VLIVNLVWESLERAMGIEPTTLAWKAKVIPFYDTRINIIMHIYDAITKDGLYIHLSMSTSTQCYIIVHDIYTHKFSMKFFTNQEKAIAFIRAIE
jgi:hypothetical protein